jgi:uncharacterized protein YbaP (TraB family)
MPRLLALATCMLCLLPLSLQAAPPAPKHPHRPLLWKISGPALEKPSWLFGTIHLGHGPVATLHPAAAEALRSSDIVYTEVSMAPASMLSLSRQFLRRDGRKLSDAIGEDLHRQLEAELALVDPAFDATVFRTFKTWAVAVTLPLLKDQLVGKPPLDAVIWQRATAAKQTTRALEKGADQLGIFDALTEVEQRNLLAETLRLLREAREAGRDPLQNLIQAYLSGDPQRVEAEVQQQFEEITRGEHRELGEKLIRKVLEERDIRMSQTLATHLQQEPGKSHFFAVGAAHCCGEKSIRTQLGQLGYEVELVLP